MRFEGDEVAGFQYRIKTKTVEADSLLLRGDTNTFVVRTRCRSVSFPEGTDGEVTRVHELEIMHLDMLEGNPQLAAIQEKML